MSERAEPTTALGMAAAMKDASKGTDVIGESVKTFSMMGGGKNQKGDVLMSADNVAGAIELIKKMIADDTAKKPAKAGKWAFRASPHAAFGKTIEDSFAAFLRWAQVGSDDEEEGGSPTQEVNVSAAFRRIEAYAEWMEGNAAELAEPPLTAQSIEAALRCWCSQATYDADGRFVWWLDFKKLDKAAIKAETVTNHLRSMVWYSHAMMYDEKAQANGMVIVEDAAQMGFWTAMTLVPPRTICRQFTTTHTPPQSPPTAQVPMDLGVKLDRLTIGILPIKMKLMLIADSPRWMSIMMGIFSRFMSKKMQKRMVVVKGDAEAWATVASSVGGKQYCPPGFGEMGGTAPDPVAAKYGIK